MTKLQTPDGKIKLERDDGALPSRVVTIAGTSINVGEEFFDALVANVPGLKEVPEPTEEDRIAERMLPANGDFCSAFLAYRIAAVIDKPWVSTIRGHVAAALKARGDERAKEERDRIVKWLRDEAAKYEQSEKYAAGICRAAADALARETEGTTK